MRRSAQQQIGPWRFSAHRGSRDAIGIEIGLTALWDPVAVSGREEVFGVGGGSRKSSVARDYAIVHAVGSCVAGREAWPPSAVDK
jgi:hypothetical protein